MEININSLVPKNKMTNKVLITTAIEEAGINFEYDGTNLKTYAAWKANGYQVKRGSKALIQCELWTPCKWKQEIEESDGSKGEIKGNKLYLKKSSLFSIDQVEAIEKKIA